MKGSHFSVSEFLVITSRYLMLRCVLVSDILNIHLSFLSPSKCNMLKLTFCFLDSLNFDQRFADITILKF